MGKRELLIIAAFAAAGVVAYRLAAPPPAPDPPFPLDNLTEIRDERKPPTVRATVTTGDTIPLPAELDEIRLADLPAVEVRGEARDSIGWSLTAEAEGPDQAAARATAAGASVRHDDLGRVVSLGMRTDTGAVRASALSLTVPSGTQLRLDGTREARVEDVAGVRLENLAGDATLRNVSGAVEGSQRNGSLTVDGAGRLALTLSGTSATLRDVRGDASVTARNGSTTIERPRAVTAVDTSDQRLTVVDASGPIRGTSRGGTILVERPADLVDFDVRDAELSIVLDRAVPVMLFGRDARIVVAVPPDDGIQFDVVVEDGTIDASAVDLASSLEGDLHTLSTTASGPRLTIRAQGSTVVIRRGK